MLYNETIFNKTGLKVIKASDIESPPVEVNFDMNNNGISYIDIETGWVKHLSGKTWMTAWKIQQFINKMQDYNKTLDESEEVKCLS